LLLPLPIARAGRSDKWLAFGSTSCCNQVEMSASVQSRNVTLGGVVAWLGWVETSHIAALNSHAGVVIQRRVMKTAQISGFEEGSQ
jgi:hypothetical protein